MTVSFVLFVDVFMKGRFAPVSFRIDIVCIPIFCVKGHIAMPNKRCRCSDQHGRSVSPSGVSWIYFELCKMAEPIWVPFGVRSWEEARKQVLVGPHTSISWASVSCLQEGAIYVGRCGLMLALLQQKLRFHKVRSQIVSIHIIVLTSDTIRYDMTILMCAQKLTDASLIYRTELKTKTRKTKKTKKSFKKWICSGEAVPGKKLWSQSRGERKSSDSFELRLFLDVVQLCNIRVGPLFPGSVLYRLLFYLLLCCYEGQVCCC